MNTKSLRISVFVAFITIGVTDFLIHAVWLSSTYGETKHLWRPEAEMQAKMPIMTLGQFMMAAVVTFLFASFVAEKRSLSHSMKFAFLMGLFCAAGQIIMYAVAPWPGSLVIKWCCAYLVQTLLLVFILHKTYRPL